jgi:hypothetical protein
MLGFKRFSRVNRSVPGTNLVTVPFGIAGLVVVMLAITLVLDGMLGDRPIVVLPHWLTVGSLDDAQSILSAILGSTSTVLALIFSVTLLVFSTASNQFGPRLMPHFLSDRTMQITLGLFLATFLHSLLTFAVAGQRDDTLFVPQLTFRPGEFVLRRRGARTGAAGGARGGTRGGDPRHGDDRPTPPLAGQLICGIERRSIQTDFGTTRHALPRRKSAKSVALHFRDRDYRSVRCSHGGRVGERGQEAIQPSQRRSFSPET